MAQFTLPTPGRELSRVAVRPLAAVAVLLGAILTATSGRYGYHRDELYFRMLEPGARHEPDRAGRPGRDSSPAATSSPLWTTASASTTRSGVCREPSGGWAAAWPRFAHLG